MSDPLTGLPTHRELSARLPVVEVRALWIDIDGLIWVNDQFGFERGDHAIAKVAAALHTTLQPAGAHLFRVAGEEFFALLGHHGRATALSLAEAAVRAIDSLEIPYRRLDQPDSTRLQINVAMLHVGPQELANSIGDSGLRGAIREAAADAVYAEKLRRDARGGVIVALA